MIVPFFDLFSFWKLVFFVFYFTVFLFFFIPCGVKNDSKRRETKNKKSVLFLPELMCVYVCVCVLLPFCWPLWFRKEVRSMRAASACRLLPAVQRASASVVSASFFLNKNATSAFDVLHISY